MEPQWIFQNTNGNSPPNFKDMVQSEEDKKDLWNYAKNPKGFLLLVGKNGRGKSYAAEAIYNMNTPYKLPQYDSDKAILISEMELYQEWLQSIQDQRSVRKDYNNTLLLVIDDFGSSKPSEAFHRFIYGIIDYRWANRNKLGTIFTTNRNTEEINEMWGTSILSRLKSGIVKRLEGEDRRISNY